MKIGDLVHYRHRPDSFGVITEELDEYVIKVSVFAGKNHWFHPDNELWDKSHWELMNESR